jgi:SAM-dependent methyltransferase
VIGADVSGGLIALARSKAPPHVEFRVGDMRALGHPDASFDAVICVFGIFFAPDTAGLAAELWRMVRPGGVLAVTTWGEGAFEPGASAFWDAVGDARPELVRGYNPWDDLVTVDGVAELLARAGIDGAVVEAEDSDQPLAEPADWWRILVGSGYRATVDALGEDERAEVERRVLAAMRDVPPMRTPAIFAVARKVRA